MSSQVLNWYVKQVYFQELAKIHLKQMSHLVNSMHNCSNSCIESFSSLLLVVSIHLHIRLDLRGQPAVLPEGGVLKGGEAFVRIQL